jgi:flavin reductase (DIM6/NTAB) family NADH-FMN oxidoreductase RutF
VKASLLKESPINFECKLRDIIDYGDGVGSGSLITGEAMKVHIADEIYDQGRIITKGWMPIGRGAGNDWFRSTDIIQKERLMKAKIQK